LFDVTWCRQDLCSSKVKIQLFLQYKCAVFVCFFYFDEWNNVSPLKTRIGAACRDQTNPFFLLFLLPSFLNITFSENPARVLAGLHPVVDGCVYMCRHYPIWLCMWVPMKLVQVFNVIQFPFMYVNIHVFVRHMYISQFVIVYTLCFRWRLMYIVYGLQDR
jgi:hypothetical protein